jgi:hypothetical protein
VPDQHSLEQVLAHHLRPVAAPPALWNRIRAPRRAPARQWLLIPAAAVLVLLASGAMWQLRPEHLHGIDMATLSRHELNVIRSGSSALDFVSHDPAAVRAWVKTNAGVDLDLPGGRSGLTGVRIVRSGDTPIVAIAYRERGNAAVLLVSGHADRSAPANTPHEAMESRNGLRLVSWTKRNQNYMAAVTSSTAMHEACLLCHADLVY